MSTTAPASAPGRDASGDEVRQFSLRAILLTIAALAAILAAISQLGCLGVYACTLIAHLATWVILLSRKRDDGEFTERQFDLTWGLLMPVVFLLGDPVMFKGLVGENSTSVASQIYIWGFDTPPQARIYSFGYIVYAVFGWQMVAIAGWRFLGVRKGPGGAFLFGTLAVGLFLIGSLAIPLLPLAVMGLVLYGAGLVLAIPAMLTWSQLIALSEACQQAPAKKDARGGWQWVLAGSLGAIVGPLIIGLGLLHAARGSSGMQDLVDCLGGAIF